MLGDLTAFVTGGYEQGPWTDVAAVPEPPHLTTYHICDTLATLKAADVVSRGQRLQLIMPGAAIEPSPLRIHIDSRRSKGQQMTWRNMIKAVFRHVAPRSVRLAAGAIVVSATSVFGALEAQRLRCEYRENPLGIDVSRPRLSWTLAADDGRRGQRQAAYRVLVATSPDQLAADQGDLWDSGKVSSAQQSHIEYRGRPLPSRTPCYWKVRVWDQHGEAADWSAPASWSMGYLEQADWQAHWIGATDQVEAPHMPRLEGYHAAEAAQADELKWVQVDLGTAHPLDAVILHPPTPAGFDDVQGFGFPVRFRIEASNDAEFQQCHTIADCGQSDYANPGNACCKFAAHGIRARYVRVTATRLWNRRSGPMPFCFALAELEVLSGGTNVALHAPVRARDTVEAFGWSCRRLTDGEQPVVVRDPGNAASYRRERTQAERNGLGAEEDDHPPYAAIMLRKEVDLPQQPVRATVYICGLGYYELYINGARWATRCSIRGSRITRGVYSTLRMTSPICWERGSVLGVLLGSGWYDSPAVDVWSFHRAPWIAPPKLLLQVDVEYADGTHDVIVSDTSWKWSTGPIVFTSIRGGETWDARREQPGWDRPGYNDASWQNAQVAPAPVGRLQSQDHPPIRVVESVRPVAVTQPKPGVYVFDLGVNMAGWARLQTRGKRGQRIKLEFNELLNPDGTVNMSHLADLTQGRFQTGEFILRGQDVEVYEPRFTYHGFRYVQVTGLSEEPSLDSLIGRIVHTDLQSAGNFCCSVPLLNRIHEMIIRTQLNNLHGIPTDCPQREKIGWMEDGCVTMEEAIYNFQMATFYTKWCRDMLDAQDANGHACPIAPSPGWGRSQSDGSPGTLSDPWWGGAIVRTPWQLYRYYGDQRILQETYDALTKYLSYVADHAPDHIAWAQEGDWLEVARAVPRNGRRPSWRARRPTATTQRSSPKLPRGWIRRKMRRSMPIWRRRSLPVSTSISLTQRTDCTPRIARRRKPFRCSSR